MIVTNKKMTVRISYKPAREFGQKGAGLHKLRNDRLAQQVRSAINRWIYGGGR